MVHVNLGRSSNIEVPIKYADEYDESTTKLSSHNIYNRGFREKYLPKVINTPSQRGERNMNESFRR